MNVILIYASVAIIAASVILTLALIAGPLIGRQWKAPDDGADLDHSEP